MFSDKKSQPLLKYSPKYWSLKDCNLIGWESFGPQLKNKNFTKYGVGERKPGIKRNLNHKTVQKSKNPYFWPLLAQIWAKTNFSKKLGAVSFGDYILLGLM